MAQRLTAAVRHGVERILKLMASDLDSVLTCLLELVKDLASLFNIRSLPLDAQPSIPGGHLNSQLFLQCLQEFEIVGVEILKRPCVVELKRLGFNH
jgi:hypothetical protein